MGVPFTLPEALTDSINWSPPGAEILGESGGASSAWLLESLSTRPPNRKIGPA